MSRKFLLRFGGRSLLSSSCFAKTTFRAGPIQITTVSSSQSSSSSSSLRLLRFPTTPTSSIPSSVTFRTLATKSSADSEESDSGGIDPDQDEALEDGDITDGWEEEDDADPQIGDGGDGGGIVLRDVPWGKRVLSIAHEILLQFSEDMKLFSFKTSPRGYIYVRLDKLSNKYGCPSMEEIENYSCLYKKRLEEVGQTGEIPDDLALEVSSPGAERLLKVPEDLERFKNMPMRVCYVEDHVEPRCPEKDDVFLLESIEAETEFCVWKLADVKENHGLLGKGRPLSRKQKDWRLRLPFSMLRKVTLYLEY